MYICMYVHVYAEADPGFLKRGLILGLHYSISKKEGSRRESNFGPNVKKSTSWAKKGARPPVPPYILSP